MSRALNAAAGGTAAVRAAMEGGSGSVPAAKRAAAVLLGR
jgi:hypothetical protein